MRYATLLVVLAALLPGVACVTTADVGSTNVAVAVDAAASPRTSAARSLYERRCGACHAVFAKSSYTPAQWRPIVEEMSELAHLDDVERDAIMAYLTAR